MQLSSSVLISLLGWNFDSSHFQYFLIFVVRYFSTFFFFFLNTVVKHYVRYLDLLILITSQNFNVHHISRDVVCILAGVTKCKKGKGTAERHRDMHHWQTHWSGTEQQAASLYSYIFEFISCPTVWAQGIDVYYLYFSENTKIHWLKLWIILSKGEGDMIRRDPKISLLFYHPFSFLVHLLCFIIAGLPFSYSYKWWFFVGHNCSLAVQGVKDMNLI